MTNTERKDGCETCSVGNLLRLKNTWQQTKNEDDKIKYLETLKHCNEKLIEDDEV